MWLSGPRRQRSLRSERRSCVNDASRDEPGLMSGRRSRNEAERKILIAHNVDFHDVCRGKDPTR